MDPTRRRIRKIDKDAQRFVAQALGNTNLSLSDYDMIHTVNRRPGITQEELRKKYCLDKGTIARRAAKLEKSLFVSPILDMEKLIRSVDVAEEILSRDPSGDYANMDSGTRQQYLKRLEKLEEVSKSFPGIASSYAIQAGREIRIMVKPEDVSEDQMVLLARDIAKKIEEELTYPGQIKVHVFRETKAVDYAK